MLRRATGSAEGGSRSDQSDPPPTFANYPPLLAKSAAEQIRRVAADHRLGDRWLVAVETKPGGPYGVLYDVRYLEQDRSTPWRLEHGVRVTVNERRPGELRGTLVIYDADERGFRFLPPSERDDPDKGGEPSVES